MRRIFAQTRKELTQIVRDRLALALALLLPLILLMLLGTAISLTVDRSAHRRQDFDDSTTSRDFIDAFRASETFRVVALALRPASRKTLCRDGAGSRSPHHSVEHFGHDLARGVNSNVQLMVEATDANTAKLVQGYAGQILRAYAQRTSGALRLDPVKTEVRLWFNPGRESKKFYGPGIFVLGLSMFPPLLAALAMAKEGEEKTILQVYVSNISAHEFLLGKIFAFMIIAFGEWVLLCVALFTYFGLHLAGDPTPFLVSTVLYSFCVAAFGTLVGAAIPNQAAAIQAVALGGFLLVFLLSGLIFPHSKHSRLSALDFKHSLGALLHRNRARCLAHRRRLAGNVVFSLDDRLSSA